MKSDIFSRTSLRVPIAVPVVYKTRTSPEFSVKSIDLTADGICVPAKEKYKAGEKIFMSIVIPGTELINCTGQVTWHGTDRIGVQFTSIPDSNRDKLIGFLNSFEKRNDLGEIAENVKCIEVALRNLKISRKEIDESMDELYGLFRNSSGKITDEIRDRAREAAISMVISQAAGELGKKLSGELSSVKKKFQLMTSSVDEKVDLKKLAICNFKPSMYYGSFCGVKFAALSEGETWDNTKCEQCVKFRNW